MSSVGVFRKVGDTDEKSHWVYTWTPIDKEECIKLLSSVWWQPPSTSFSCPAARIRFLKLDFNTVEDMFDNLHLFNTSPHFPSTRCSDQQGGSLLDCNNKRICKLPVAHLDNVGEDFWCGACGDSRVSTSYYECLECEEKFHKECVESPLVIKHPSHPFHSLRLYYIGDDMKCVCCGISSSFFYRCDTCNLNMHPICAMRSIPFVEDHPKSHHHPLTLFPAQASLVCHICGLINPIDPTYICIQCVFVIHKGCIGFPHVIRISRHKHRLSFTSSLPSGELSCGICRKQVDNNYGAYSCSKNEAYFVHSKCALNRKIWDGKYLDGVPEEDDMIDDGEPFKRIADGIILHPFHIHNLQLQISKAYDEKNYCQGCALPIYEGQFYSCMDMDCVYILHETCASAPRMKRHPLYPHPLTLVLGDANGIFICCACGRESNCFFYEHQMEKERCFVLDLRCASITEPFDYPGHGHPLFLPLDPAQYSRCQMCKYQSCDKKFNCTVCDYIICFRCATFPYKIRYKHENHFLTICNGKEASEEPDWCEVCEGKIKEVTEGYYGYEQRIKREKRYYKCEDCSMALHVDCSLGRDIYMKPGQTIKDFGLYSYIVDSKNDIESIMVTILLNSSLSRPICLGCYCRCPFPIVFQVSNNKMFCSWDCMGHMQLGY